MLTQDPAVQQAFHADDQHQQQVHRPDKGVLNPTEDGAGGHADGVGDKN